jgi:4-oxalocrotonate tautomerase family enzyme
LISVSDDDFCIAFSQVLYRLIVKPLATRLMYLPLVEMYFSKGALSESQKAELSRKITDLVVKEAGQPQHYTWVIIHEIPAENWMVDRLTLPELKAKLTEKKG